MVLKVQLMMFQLIFGIGFYFYDNTSLKYEVPIDMNNKDITGLNNLDVNGQINMNGNKIIGVGNGTANSDAVNKKQFDNLETQINLEVSQVDNKIIQIRNDINTILNSLKKLEYYYFTDQLKHDETNTVKFPALNSYPYSTVDNSEFIKIELNGYYQIIHSDFYIKRSQFIIHDDTNGNNIFVSYLSYQGYFTPITINAVVSINVDNGFNYARIKMYNKKLCLVIIFLFYMEMYTVHSILDIYTLE